MWWLLVTLGYLLGSFPTSYIAGRFITGRDIRQMGDENAGAANAYRELGRNTGIIVGIIDAAKGSFVVLIAKAVGATQPIVLTAGLAAVIGHNWPVYLGFKGGRGVSTALGVLLVVETVPMLILTLPTLVILIFRRSVTPAMAFLFIGLAILGWLLKVPPVLIAYGIALPVLIGITTLFRVRHKRLNRA